MKFEEDNLEYEMLQRMLIDAILLSINFWSNKL